MKTYRVEYSQNGRSQAEYVSAISPASAEIQVEKMRGVPAKIAVEVPEGVTCDREWARAAK